MIFDVFLFLSCSCILLGIPGLKRDLTVNTKPLLLDIDEDFSDLRISSDSISDKELKAQKPREWSNTWSARYDTQKLQNKIRA